MSDPVHIEAAEAIAAATAQAWTENFDDDRGREPRTLVHSVLISGSMMLGADWDIDELVTELNRAKEIAWFDDFMGHELAMSTTDGRVYKFEVKRPAGAA